MKSQKLEVNRQKCVILIIACIIAIAAACTFTFASEKAEKWEGVDKAVVERIAKEQGRKASALLINTEQGDLMLFLFLSAGAAGGFLAGYSYRALTERQAVRNGKAA
ncbi:MAG TPA: hypothetical protein VLH56_17585 [Dissulfurispiraceae bacterium]|nr:hypothetical protein [Dissulfurispiraceae bacterium]